MIRITEVRILFPVVENNRLQAYVKLCFENQLVVDDVRVIKRADGSFVVGMPSRKRESPCPACGTPTPVPYKFCAYCGILLPPNRNQYNEQGEVMANFMDFVFPCVKELRNHLNAVVLEAYAQGLAFQHAQKRPNDRDGGYRFTVNKAGQVIYGF